MALAKTRAGMESGGRPPNGASSAGSSGIISATREKCSSAMPMWKSASSRAAISSRKKSADGAAVNAPHQFADQIALGDGVVAALAARRPPRLLRRQIAYAGIPVVERLGALERRIEAGHAGGVAHEMPNFGVFLAVLPVLRPVVRHLRVEVQQPTVGKQEGAQEGHRLRRGVDVDDGVFLPRPGSRLVRVPGPQIHHELPLHGGRETRPHIAMRREVALERIAHGGETAVAKALDVHLFVILPWRDPRQARKLSVQNTCGDGSKRFAAEDAIRKPTSERSRFTADSTTGSAAIEVAHRSRLLTHAPSRIFNARPARACASRLQERSGPL